MIRARIKAIRDAHSERSQIQATDEEDHEYRLEVPTAALAGVSRSRELLLVISWVIEEVPLAASSSVDAEFAALMESRRRDPLTGLLPKSDAAPRDPLTELLTGAAASATPRPSDSTATRDPLTELLTGAAAVPASATPRPSDSAVSGGPPAAVPAAQGSSQASGDLESQLLTSSVRNQSSINLERQLAALLGTQ